MDGVLSEASDADEFERGRCRFSRSSRGGSSFATLECLSSPLLWPSELLRLGHCDVERDNTGVSESLSDSSHRDGYLSLADLVGLDSTTRVSVRARPFESTVRITEVRSAGFGVSAIEDNEARLMRSLFSGEDRLGRLAVELLRAKVPECITSCPVWL